MNTMRLDKYISQVTNYSRAEVKRLIKAEAITVDGELEKNSAYKVSPEQTVAIDGEALEQPGNRYFMLNKPQGYVCATTDSEHPTVLDLIDEPNLDKLQIAGRLDIDTTGLVLITDDGKWNHAITSPKRDCNKIYYVCTARDISDDTAERFKEGVMLDGEIKPTQPATLEVLFSNEANLTISEGKYHQIKRMFAAVSNHVEELHRHTVGGIVLDEELEPGEYRALTQAEIDSINV